MKKEYTPVIMGKNEGGGRRIAIGDIHGCFYSFESLLKEKLQINKKDQIFLLGDTIDKGLNSALVLDLIIDLKENNYQIFPIRGNHEEQLLMAYNCGFDFFENYLNEYNSLDLIGERLDEYLGLISNFEYCIELDDFVLSHSGINKGRINPFTDLRGMFPDVKFKFEEERLTSKIQVHGHLVKTISEIENSILNKERRFSIDSGCYLANEEFGYLTALDLDEMKLFFQKKKEGNENKD